MHRPDSGARLGGRSGRWPWPRGWVRVPLTWGAPPGYFLARSTSCSRRSYLGGDSDERNRMDDGQPVAVLEELLAAKGEHLLRTAVLLAGSHTDGEDLLQAALERVFRRWRTISGDPEGYLRRTLYHLAADGWRRKRAWRDRLPLLGPAEAQPDGTGAVDQRDHL